MLWIIYDKYINIKNNINNKVYTVQNSVFSTYVLGDAKINFYLWFIKVSDMLNVCLTC